MDWSQVERANQPPLILPPSTGGLEGQPLKYRPVTQAPPLPSSVASPAPLGQQVHMTVESSAPVSNARVDAVRGTFSVTLHEPGVVVITVASPQLANSTAVQVVPTGNTRAMAYSSNVAPRIRTVGPDPGQGRYFGGIEYTFVSPAAGQMAFQYVPM